MAKVYGACKLVYNVVNCGWSSKQVLHMDLQGHSSHRLTIFKLAIFPFLFSTYMVCGTGIALVVCFQRALFHTQTSLKCYSSLLLLSYFPPFFFHLGQRTYEKRSSVLAEVLMVLEIELWAIDPHTPDLKMRPPSRILLTVLLPRTGLLGELAP